MTDGLASSSASPIASLSARVCCPTHRVALSSAADGSLICPRDQEVFPVVDGIPILLPSSEQRQRVVETNWTQTQAASPLDFYNQTRDHDQYCRSELNAVRCDIERWFDQARAPGAVLEIGSGKGALQGIGQEYVALDYSFTALRRYISPAHQRICGTAEQLPLADGTVKFLFTIAALEHVPDAAKAFSEVDRVLAPGGIAYLHPAWHCVQYNCDGIPVRPYRDLNPRQKLTKAILPILQQPGFKAAAALPGRLLRRLIWRLQGKPATTFRFRKLNAEYTTFWISDSDACSRLDSHEGALFFYSRGYEMLSPAGRSIGQVLMRHRALVVRKPAG